TIAADRHGVSLDRRVLDRILRFAYAGESRSERDGPGTRRDHAGDLHRLDGGDDGAILGVWGVRAGQRVRHAVPDRPHGHHVRHGVGCRRRSCLSDFVSAVAEGEEALKKILVSLMLVVLAGSAVPAAEEATWTWAGLEILGNHQVDRKEIEKLI